MNRETSVLLVADEEDDFVVVRDQLAKVKSGRYALEWARTFDDGVAALARGRYDLALIDDCLGAKSGLDLVRIAAARDSTMPFIVLTGHDDHDVDVERMAAGAVDYIVRGCLTPDSLERSIRHALRHATIVRELRAQARKQASVAELGELALSGVGLPRVIADGMARLREVLGVDLVSLLELLPSGEEFRLHSGLGFEPGLVGARGILRNSQAGYTVTRREPIVVDDQVAETRFGPSPILGMHGVLSGMSVLVGSLERPWGVLGVHSRTRRGFSGASVSFLQGIANVLAATIARELADEAFRESRSFLEHSQEAGGVGSWKCDLLDGGVVWSTQTYRLYGVPVGTPVTLAQQFSLIHPDDRETFLAFRSRAIVERVPRHHEYRIIRPDGVVRWLQARALSVRDDSGEARWLLGVTVDVTERVEAERRLKESVASHQALFDTSLDAVLICDDQGRYVDANPAASTLLGRTRDEILRSSVASFTPPDTREAVLRTWQRIAQEGDARGECVLRRSDGSLREAEFAAKGNFTPGLYCTRFFGHQVDVIQTATRCATLMRLRRTCAGLT